MRQIRGNLPPPKARQVLFVFLTATKMFAENTGVVLP